MVTLCPSCRNAVEVPDGNQPRTYQCPLCQNPFVVGTVAQAVPVATRPAAPKAGRSRPATASTAKSLGWLGWSVLYGAALVLVGGMVMNKLQRPPLEPTGDQPLTAEQVVESMGDHSREQYRVSRRAKLREVRDARITEANSIDESLKLLEQERGEVQQSRQASGMLYARLWFEGDAAAGQAMVDARLAVMTEAVRQLKQDQQRVQASIDAIDAELQDIEDNKFVEREMETVPGPDGTGSGFRFKQGDRFSMSRLWPEMRRQPALASWLAARSLEDESDLSWYLILRESGRGGNNPPLPAVLGEVRPDSTGTGFWVSPDGYLVTNHHVVRGARAVVLRRDSGQTLQATVVAQDERRDLALLKAETSCPEWLALSAGVARQGLKVFTQGFPMADVMGVEAKFEEGFISSVKGIRDDPDTYQISMPVRPGNSGGALVHTSEQTTGSEMPWVVGVLVSRLIGEERVSYAIKSSVVVDFFKEVPAAAPLLSQSPVRPQGSAIEHARKASCLVMVKTR